MAPKGTPRPVIDRLAKEVNALAQNKEYVEKLGVLYGTPGHAKTPEEFEKLIDAKAKEWSDIVTSSGVSIR